MPRVLLWNWDKPAPTRLPRWIIGPSGPTGIPAPTANAQDTNLTAYVLMLKMCRTIVPLRKPISSGMPEPAALGLRSTTRAVLINTKVRL